MTLAGKTVVVLGAGRSGRAAAALALREGATVHAHDAADISTTVVCVVSSRVTCSGE